MKYYSAIEKNNTCNNMNESQKHYEKWKKPDTKPYTLYDTTYWLSGKGQNYRDRNIKSVIARGCGGGGGEDWLQRGTR